MDDFNKKLGAAAVISNTAFINLVVKEVASRKRQKLGKCFKKVSNLKLLCKGCPQRTSAIIRPGIYSIAVYLGVVTNAFLI